MLHLVYDIVMHSTDGKFTIKQRFSDKTIYYLEYSLSKIITTHSLASIISSIHK